MGLEANDPDLRNAEAFGGQRVVTPAGMVLDGTRIQNLSAISHADHSPTRYREVVLSVSKQDF